MRRAQYICLPKTASNRRCKPATHFAYRSRRDAKMRPSLSTTHSASVPLSSTRHPVTPTSVLGHRILVFFARRGVAIGTRSTTPPPPARKARERRGSCAGWRRCWWSEESARDHLRAGFGGGAELLCFNHGGGGTVGRSGGTLGVRGRRARGGGASKSSRALRQTPLWGPLAKKKAAE